MSSAPALCRCRSLERGLGTPQHGQPLTVDGRPSLVRLTASSLEWSAAARGEQATQSIPFCEMLSAWQLEPDTAKWQEQRLHRLAVYSFARAARRRSEWHPRRLLLASPDQGVVRQLCEDIRTGALLVCKPYPRVSQQQGPV